jgi:TraM recognition site of TraD and TraG
MADILDGGILLARLPKGVLGDDACRLVGSLLLAQLWQTALTRAAVPEDERLDAAAYVDEAHNFLHMPIGLDDALGEARGYRLSLVLAHQHLGQLPREMAEALHANARNKLFFTVSPDDAKRLAGHVGPYLTADDLYRLDRYQAACRLVIDQRNSTGFTIATRPAPPLIEGRADQLRTVARAHGLPRATRERQAKRRRYRAVSGSLSDSVSGSLSGSLSALQTDSEPDRRRTPFPQAEAMTESLSRFPTGLYKPPGAPHGS